MRRAVALVAVLLIFVTAPFAWAGHEKDQTFAEHAKRGTALPKAAQSVQALSWNGRNHCTISSINDKSYVQVEMPDRTDYGKRVVGLWLTAAHCVEQEQAFEIAGHAAFVVKADYLLDVAVMGTYDWALPMLEVSDDAPQYGDFVEMWGHPLGWDSLIYFKGYVSNPSMHEADMEREDMRIALYNLDSAPGSSGSAVLDKHHRIVGMLQFAFRDTGFGMVRGGVTYSDLKRFLASYLPEA